MRLTVFNTPIISYLLKALAKMCLLISGWKVEGNQPRVPRYILVAAPHTSKWDFFIGMAVGLSHGIEAHWLGKSSLFRRPLGSVMRWLGGIPVDRDRRGSLVDQSICCFKGNKQLGLIICPEGTRSKGDRWRTGFYHIARGAEVPIILAYMDFRKKKAGFGPTIKPGCSMKKDLAEIQAFYDKKQGKHPNCFSPVL
ncbi:MULTISPECIES: lysophospholipid acyltransferase family protein [unclassified Endozoicomonas]|uniref:lysophospholipid acyltransferase family protein n=1 Tax=unclassified Endozoicomonas TaxID=2644528 RepID=UPI0021481AF3|nr:MULTISPECIES: lysophospholipid acyltransferase family protein [unclassified Endozoicomonas]